ncbi:MAG: protein-disulfide reductase DsbD [Gammaproteobacteria bacterium]
MTRPFAPWFALLFTLFGGLALSGPASAVWEEDELLEPDAAFAFSARVTGPDSLTLRWDVAEGYYLYRERIQLRSETAGIVLGEARFPAGVIKDDEFFGRVETYRGQVEIEVPLRRAAGAPEVLRLSAVSQGCADRGICYPPHTQTAELRLASAAPPPATPAAGGGALAKIKALGQQMGQQLGLNGASGEFLDPELAFRASLSVTADGTALIARWDIAEGYYLYRDKLRVELAEGAGVTLHAPQLPAGEIKQDETFGRVEVYHNQVEARVPLSRAAGAATPLRVTLGYQGCAEAGICYPPQSTTLDLHLAAAGEALAAPVAALAVGADAAPPDAPLTAQDRIAQRLADDHRPLVLLSFFGFGLLLAFTPCVFPMIPILSSIIIGQGPHLTTRRAFTLSLVYVLAMALTYTAVGVIAGLSGENLQAAFQNPWILSGFAAVFVLLSLSMFGFYELQLPTAWQSKLSELSNRQQGGTLVGVGIMGFLSALIVGPCVAAPLAGALIYIGQAGDPYLGGMALFALSLGMGAPLLAIGTGAGRLMPHAGGWMNTVRAVFGVLLLAVAIWMLERILPAAVSMALWAVLLITSAVYMGALERLDIDATGWHKLWKGLGLILLIQGALLLAGVAGGGQDPLQPLRGTALTGAGITATTGRAQLEFRKVKSIEDIEREVDLASTQGKAVMLDFFAEWCTDCHRMIKHTFSNAEVQAALAGSVLLKADVTANDATDKALLKHFRLLGPPAILFFGSDGQELSRHRVAGYMNAEQFAAHVNRAYGRE